MRLHPAAAIAGSTLIAFVFATHAFVAFTPVRVKTIRTSMPSVAGRVVASAPETPRILDAPTAIVWTVANASATPVDLTLTVNERTVCERQVAPTAGVRLDCQDRGTRFTGHEVLTVVGPTAAWSVTSLEVANLHGRSSSPENLAVLPAGSTAYERPSILSVVMLWLVATVVLLAPAPTRPKRSVRVLQVCAAAVAAALLTTTAVTSIVSAYAVVVSAWTFVQWLAILFGLRLWAAARWMLGAGATVASVRTRALLQRAALGVGVFVLFGVVVEGQLERVYHHNYSGFLHISKDAFDHNAAIEREREAIRPTLILEDPGGYDGQWMYFMAFDPFLRAFHDDPERYNGVVDAPPYRFARIGFSVLTRILSAGQWQRFPATMVWIVWLGLVGAALALSELARSYGRSPWLGALVLIVPGFRLSLGTGLPEPAAAALMMTALFAASRKRWAIAAVLCAASLLTRETGLILVLAVLCYATWKGEWRRALIYGTIAVAPFALWRLYVGVSLHSVWGTQAFFYSPDDIGVPFGGIRDLWATVRSGTYYADDPAMARSAITYPILLTTGLGLAAVTTVVAFNPCALAAVGYGLLAISLRFGSIWVHVGNGQRGTFELFLMLAASWTQSAQWPRWLKVSYGIFAVMVMVYVFFGSFDAEGTLAGLTRLL